MSSPLRSQDNTILGNTAKNVLVGFAGNDLLDGGLGADAMSGGAGNDAYYVEHKSDRIIELAGEGWDVVWSRADYVAPVHVEQLNLTGSAVRGTLTSAGTLNGNEAANILTGSSGGDRLTDKGGSDTFVFARGFGRDTITDFNVAEDRIDWSAIAKTGATPSLADAGSHAVATFGSDTLTFWNTKAADLMGHGIFA